MNDGSGLGIGSAESLFMENVFNYAKKENDSKLVSEPENIDNCVNM